jgi:hypothetical protein
VHVREGVVTIHTFEESRPTAALETAEGLGPTAAAGFTESMETPANGGVDAQP